LPYVILKVRAQFSAADRRNTLLQILRGTQAAPEAAGLSTPSDTVALKQVCLHSPSKREMIDSAPPVGCQRLCV
jgi:hypothetical protein